MPTHGVCDLKPFLFLSLPCLCLVFQNGSVAAFNYITEACGEDWKNATEYAPNSAYESNLKLLLSSLSSNATPNTGFRNFTAGGRDAIYGLSLCRGDVDADVCQDCVADASRLIVQNCARVRSAIIWYDECKLRFSNESFFNTMSEAPRLLLRNTGNVSEVSRFMELLGGTMNDAATRAASDRTPPEKFATEEKNFTTLQSLYTLVQCTPDLNSGDCNRCLKTGIAQFPDYGSQGAQTLMPSCHVRYELYPFYNLTGAGAVTPPPPPIIRRPPPRPPVSTTNPRGKLKHF